MAAQTGTRYGMRRHPRGGRVVGAFLAVLAFMLVALVGVAPAQALAADVTMSPFTDKTQIQSVTLSVYNDTTQVSTKNIAPSGDTTSATEGQLVYLDCTATEGYGVAWSVVTTDNKTVDVVRNVIHTDGDDVETRYCFTMPASPVTVSIANVTATVSYAVKHTVDSQVTTKVIHEHPVVIGQQAPDIVATLVNDWAGYGTEALTLPSYWVTDSGATYSFAAPVSAPLTLYAVWPQSASSNVSSEDQSILTKKYFKVEYAVNNDRYTPIEVRLAPEGSTILTMRENPGLTSIVRSGDVLGVAAESPSWVRYAQETPPYIKANATSMTVDRDVVLYCSFATNPAQNVVRWIPVRFVTAYDDDSETVERLVYTELVHYNIISNTGNVARQINLTKVPSREGYTFSGWSLYPNGTTYNQTSGIVYNFDRPVTELLTLKAKWKTVTHTVTYYSGNNVAAVEEVEYGKTTTPPVAVDDGSVLTDRWTTDPEGNDPYDFSEPVYGDLSLYAQWVPTDGDGDETPEYHIVTFVAKHGDGETILETRLVKHGSLATKPAAAYFTDEAGKKITATDWTSDAAGQTVFDFATTPINEDMKLYAKWSDSDTHMDSNDPAHHAVTFIVDKAVFALQDVVDGGYVLVPATPSQTGKTFDGWYTGPDGTGTKLTIPANASEGDATTTPVTADTTYYAKFSDTPVTSHRVTYKYVSPSDGTVATAFGVMVGQTAAATMVNDGDVIAEPTTIGNYTDSTGATTLKWFVDEACTAAYNFSAPVKDDITLYATYITEVDEPGEGEVDERPEYTVSFFVNGACEKTVRVRQGELPATSELPATPTLPEGSSGTFVGWRLQNDEDGVLWLNPDGTYTTAANGGVYGDTYVYASWDLDPVYVVTFVNAGNSSQDPYYLTVVNKDADTSDGLISVADTRTAATSVGLSALVNSDTSVPVTWYADAACTAAYDITKPVTQNMTLYAGAAGAAPTFTTRYVHFRSLGRDVGEAVVLTNSTTPPAAPDLTAITREGYRFDAWRVGTADAEDPNGVLWEDVASVTAEHTYVYGTWASVVPANEQYTVTFMSLGEAVMTGIINPGETITAPTVSIPNVSGATFAGWYTDESFADESRVGGANVVLTPPSTIVYYAKFVDGNGNVITGPLYTVRFFVNNELKSSTQVAANEQPYATTTGTADGTSLRTGYEAFDGWYTNQRLVGSPLTDASLPAVTGKVSYYAQATLSTPEPPGNPITISVSKTRATEAPAGSVWANFTVQGTVTSTSEQAGVNTTLFSGFTTADSLSATGGASVVLSPVSLPAGYKIAKYVVDGTQNDPNASGGYSFTAAGTNMTVEIRVEPIAYAITQSGDQNFWYTGTDPVLPTTYTIESSDITLPVKADFTDVPGWTFAKWTGTVADGGVLRYVDGTTGSDGGVINKTSGSLQTAADSTVAGGGASDRTGLTTIKSGSYGDVTLTPNWVSDPYYLYLADPTTATNATTLSTQHYPQRVAIHYGTSVVAEEGSSETGVYTATMRNASDTASPMVSGTNELPKRTLTFTLLGADGGTWQTREVTYDFDGYWDAADATTGLHAATGATQYVDGDGKPTDDLTIYSTPNVSAPLNLAWKELSSTEKAKLTLPTTAPSKEGYDFVGWKISWTNDPNGRPSNYDETYPAGATLPELTAADTGDGAITLTPVYEISSYTITYEGNAPADGVTVKVPVGAANTSYSKDMSEDLTLGTPSISDAGYTFLGWKRTSPTGTLNEELDGDYVTALKPGNATDITYTAQWSPNRYKVILKPGDRTNTSEVSDPTNVYVVHNDTTKLYANSTGSTAATPSKPTCTYTVDFMKATTGDEKLDTRTVPVDFEGYRTPDGELYLTFSDTGTPTYPSNKIFGVTGETTLYGSWDDDDRVITMPAAPEGGSGTFVGWVLVDGDDNPKSDPIATGGTYELTGTESNVRFRPYWRAADASVITYTSNPAGATYAAGYNPNTLDFVSSTGGTFDLTAPELKGYTFSGWTVTRTDASDTFSVDDITTTNDKLTIPASTVTPRNITLTANFTYDTTSSANKCTIEANLNDGTIRKDPTNPTKNRSNWQQRYAAAMSTDDGYTLTYDEPDDIYTKSVVFTADGGDAVIGNPSTIPTGYTFAGWRIDEVRSIEATTGGWAVTVGTDGEVRYLLTAPTGASSSYVPYVSAGGSSYVLDPEAGIALAKGSTGTAKLVATWEPISYTVNLWLNDATSPKAGANGVENADYYTSAGNSTKLPRATMSATYDEPYVPAPSVDGLKRVTNVHYHGNTGDEALDASRYDSDVVLNHTFAGWDKSTSANLSSYYIPASATEVGVLAANNIYDNATDELNGTSLYAHWTLNSLGSQGLYRENVNAGREGYTFVGWVRGEGATEADCMADANARINGNGTGVTEGMYKDADDNTWMGIRMAYLLTVDPNDPSVTDEERESAKGALDHFLITASEDFDGDPDAHLYAVWMSTYAISYLDANGTPLSEIESITWPTVLGNNPNPSEFVYNGGTDSVSLVSPQRTGYTFSGWTVGSPTGTSLTYDSTTDRYLLPKTIGNKVLYAHFEVEREYVKLNIDLPNKPGTVTFMVSGQPLAEEEGSGTGADRTLTVTQTVVASEQKTDAGAVHYTGSVKLLLPTCDPDGAGYTVKVVEADPWFDVSEGTVTSDGSVSGLVASGLKVTKLTSDTEVRHWVTYTADTAADTWTPRHRGTWVVNQIATAS